MDDWDHARIEGNRPSAAWRLAVPLLAFAVPVDVVYGAGSSGAGCTVLIVNQIQTYW